MSAAMKESKWIKSFKKSDLSASEYSAIDADVQIKVSPASVVKSAGSVKLQAEKCALYT